MGREREREEEKHQCVVASQVPPTGDPALNPGMCHTSQSYKQFFKRAIICLSLFTFK